DQRLPADWPRLLIKIWDPHLAEIPDAKVTHVRLRLNRSELGQITLHVHMTPRWRDQNGGDSIGISDTDLATGRSPSAAKPDNAAANAALRGQPPFDRVITLRPEPSCPTVRKMLRGQVQRLPYGLESAAIGDLQRPHVFSADVWEAVHRETGLPIV